MMILTSKQKQALLSIQKNKTTLLYGGSRSGKTFLICLYMHFQALKYNNLWQVAVRKYAKHAKQSLFYKTFMDVLACTHDKQHSKNNLIKINKSEITLEYHNGSRIIIGGLDDKDRTEKILGNEYATIFLNEASQISYDSYQMLLTRLNPPKNVDGKILIDYNPPSKLHWGYSIFEQRLNPIDHTSVPKDDFACIRMNPEHNKENLSKDYVSTLQNLSIKAQDRFIHGYYTDHEGALWQQEWFSYPNVPLLSSLLHITIGVDPAGSSTGDTVGIVVCATDGKQYYVLEDSSQQGASVYTWAKIVSDVYNRYMEAHGSVEVIAEKNYGGGMVEVTLQALNPNMNITLVQAIKSKEARAGPICSLYEQGLVLHTPMKGTPPQPAENETFDLLLNELLSWTPEASYSPGRMDALVWGLRILQDKFGALISFHQPTLINE